MPRYRKRPIVIEAFQVLPPEEYEKTGSVPVWVVHGITNGVIILDESYKDSTGFSVMTKEGKMHGEVTDWIIKGVEDELYICKNSIFMKTYELVKD